MLNSIDLSPYKAVLFDLDATLAPYVQAEMSDVFFSSIESFEKENGYDGFADAFNYAFRTMKQNDGSTLNKDVFNTAFYSKLPDAPYNVEDVLDEFYGIYFRERVKPVIRYRGSEKAMLAHLRKAGKTVICATNPVFPISASLTRMNLSGIDPKDFDYVTHHFNCTYCKPKREYFMEVMAEFNLHPEECIMIGNDTLDDLGAPEAGIRTVLISDYLLNRANIDTSAIETISYDDFLNSVYSL